MSTTVLLPGLQEEMALLAESHEAKLIWCLSKDKDGIWWVIANDDKTVTCGHPNLEAALKDLHAKQMVAETKSLYTISTQPDGKYRVDGVQDTSIVHTDLVTFSEVVEVLARLLPSNIQGTVPV